VIRYDAPGHGRSPVPDRSYSEQEVLRDLLRALGVERADLVGLSLGGRTLADFAVQDPEMVRSLVLVAPGLNGWAWSEEMLERLTRIARTARAEGPEAAAELWLADPYMVPAMEHPELRDRVRRLHLENAHTWIVALPTRVEEPLAIERLAGISAPTLILVGDRDVPDIQGIAEKLAAEIPGARKVVLPGVGHMVNLEAPTRFDEEVLGFLAQGRETR
jgi:pimeloyl-ACP methyl ester carboxylesterase